MIKYFCYFLLTSFLTFSIISCKGNFYITDFIPGYNIETKIFYLPEYPDSHPKIDFFKIILIKDGKIEIQIIDATEKYCEIQFNKNVVTPILCYPIIKKQNKEINFFYPAGGIYPFTSELTWLNGFAAEILYSILIKDSISFEKSSYFSSKFNWNKFLQILKEKELDAKEKNLYFSPWLFDKQKILSDISKKEFKIYSFKSKNIINIDILKQLKKNNILTSETKTFYHPYIPIAPIKINLNEQELQIPLIPSTDKLSLYKDNSFFDEEKYINFFVTQNNKLTLAITEIEMYTNNK